MLLIREAKYWPLFERARAPLFRSHFGRGPRQEVKPTIDAWSNKLLWQAGGLRLPSFNRDGSPLCSAAILEPVWIRKGPLTSFSRKLAPSAPTLVHDRCRSSDEGRHVPQFASIQAAQSHKPQSRRAYPTAMNCINRAKLTKVNPKKEWILFIIIVTRARANPHSNSLSLPTSTPLC